MEISDVKDLETGVLQHTMYHRNGQVLLSVNRQLTQDDLDHLVKAKITTIVIASAGQSAKDVSFECKFERTPLTDMLRGRIIPDPIYGQDGRLLLNGGAEVTDTILNRLKERGVENIYIKRNRKVLQTSKYHVFKRLLEEREAEHKIEKIVVDLPASLLIKTDHLSRRDVDKYLESAELIVKAGEDPLLPKLKLDDKLRIEGRPQALKDNFSLMHKDLLDETKDLFEALQHNKRISTVAFNEIIGLLMGALIQDRDLLVNLTHVESDPGSYLLTHSLSVTSLAINMACHLGYEHEQILELAYGAFLYDIGMLKVPREILLKESPLTTNERMLIQRHPIFSLDILQKITELPMTTAFVAYQAHERMDGRGYPYKKSNRAIHDFSKIVTIADIYDALTRDRPYRARLTPYRAMEGVLKMAGRRMIDGEILRSFIQSVSMFPVGSFVVLNDGAIAKVVGATDQMTQPIVSVIYQNNEVLITPQRFDLRDAQTPKVLRSLDLSNSKLKGDLMSGF